MPSAFLVVKLPDGPRIQQIHLKSGSKRQQIAPKIITKTVLKTSKSNRHNHIRTRNKRTAPHSQNPTKTPTFPTKSHAHGVTQGLPGKASAGPPRYANATPTESPKVCQGKPAQGHHGTRMPRARSHPRPEIANPQDVVERSPPPPGKPPSPIRSGGSTAAVHAR